MAEQYIVGVAGVIAFLLGFVFLVRSWGLSKLKRAASMEFPKESCVNKNGNGEGEGEGVGTTEIIIVGAGVAGAALAYSLGKDGRRVRVIERDLNAPNRIAGEGLMPGGYLKLIELGLGDCVDEIDAQQILGYTLYKDGKDAPISFPLEKFQSHVSAKNFHNGRFVQRLRKKAASLHNVSLEQGTVTSLLEENGIIKGVHYKDKSGQMLTASAPLTVVCDDPSPILFYPISGTEIRCLVDVPSQNLPSVSNGEMAHYLKTLVAPKVLPEAYNSFISAIEKKDNIRIMPNKIMAGVPHLTPGAFLIGDAFNTRHAITGGGMTVALSDVVILRDLLRPLHDLSDASAICKYLESFYTLRKPMSSTINTLANVLHKVFSASSDPAMENMQQTLFGYLKLGGFFSSGVSAMFSGLCPRPLSLAFHFFVMAMYGVGQLLFPFPSPKRLLDGAKLLWVASSVFLPIIHSEGIRQMFFPLTVPAYYRTPPKGKKI
ncbi:Squalene monooxygenase [Gossypium arboreum]|uniref:Squalene monooxygenase n=1 Tax=Gossypium arboreum TaxID=29729 RepID=A0A0B0PGK5_GOSAR|nr:Squalene monooxygenase [Gossypium arboreum]